MTPPEVKKAHDEIWAVRNKLCVTQIYIQLLYGGSPQDYRLEFRMVFPKEQKQFYNKDKFDEFLKERWELK